MKTPEEIKHTLERCKSHAGCKECPYFSKTECFDAMHPDALVEKMHEWADALREIDIEAVQHKLAELKGEQHESE